MGTHFACRDLERELDFRCKLVQGGEFRFDGLGRCEHWVSLPGLHRHTPLQDKLLLPPYFSGPSPLFREAGVAAGFVVPHG